MAAEAVYSREFKEAFDRLDEEKRLEVDFALYAIEDDPGWKPRRYVAPADSRYSGFVTDLSVDGYAIVYRVVDRGATVEIWYLYELPGYLADRPNRDPEAPAPFM
jgi:mRNA-degrading endonuclease RelE of RelBE toxin-antitoxin system